MPERIVVALGGNALIRQGDRGTAAEQATRSLIAMEALASLLTADRQVVITHGNGPTVGNILIRQHLAQNGIPSMPLDVCGAESQGNIGYLLERALQQVLRQRQPPRPVATLLTMVAVDPQDQAFAHPTKPIGPFLSKQEAEGLAHTAPVMSDSDRGFRRVVASPTPRHILEIAALEALLDAGVIVIALGGGGIPVAFTDTQQLIGLEAVIDKDLSSSLLAREIGASTLIILTDIDCVYLDFLSPRRRPLRQVSVAEAEAHLRNGEFLPGSMKPKIEAGIAFLRAGGQRVCIGLPEALPDLLEGSVGTTLFT